MMVAFALVAMTWISCAFSGYKFNGASIDYTKTKTIQIADFPYAQAMYGDLWDRCSTIS